MIVPDHGDDSTLFICSGMQRVKCRFHSPDGGRHGSLQSCVRTDDIDLVGDGSHLTCFEMIGNFSFGGEDYQDSVELWHSILTDLRISVTEVHCFPTRDDHQQLWRKWGYSVVPDSSCVRSDGQIGGHCCELFCGDLEIGNLVNPMGHSVDVGFGWERLHQVVERVEGVDQTSLFDQNLHPVVSDHVRTISIMRENGVVPGNKGRNYVCRRLVRRLLQQITSESFPFDDWLSVERELRERNMRQGRRSWKKFRDRPMHFWWETFGILPEEIDFIRSS